MKCWTEFFRIVTLHSRSRARFIMRYENPQLADDATLNALARDLRMCALPTGPADSPSKLAAQYIEEMEGEG